MKKVLLVMLVLALALAAAGAALLNDASIGRFLQRWLSAELARPISIDGDFSAELGFPLRLKATSVRLANPEWVGTPDMATARQVEVAIDVRTLFGDQPLVLDELVINGLEGELVRDASGRDNWTFGATDSGGPGANFAIRQLELSDWKLSLERPDVDKLTIEIDSLTQREKGNGLLDLKLQGKLQQREVAAVGQLGPFRNLLEGKDIQIALNGHFGDLQLAGNGRIDDLASPRQPELQLSLEAPDARQVGDMLGLDVEAAGDIQLDLKIVPAQTGIEFSGDGHWAQTRLSASGTAENLQKLDGIKLEASGKGPDLKSTMFFFGVRGMPDAPFEFSGDVLRDGENLTIGKLNLTIGKFLFRLSGDMRRFPSLNDANLSLAVKGDDVARFREVFGLPGLAEGPFSMDASLARGPAGKDEFKLTAETQLFKVKLDGSLGKSPGYVGTLASLRADGASLGRLSRLFLSSELKDQPFEVKADIEIVPQGYQLKPGSRITSGDAIINVAGLLGPDPMQQDTKLDWTLSGVDLRDIGQLMTPPQDYPARRIDASGTTTVRPDDLVFSDVQGTIGKSQFQISGQLGRKSDFRGSDLRLRLRGPELERLAFLVGDANLPAGPYQLSGRLQRTAEGLSISESIFDVAHAKGKAEVELALPTSPLAVKFDVEIQGPDASALWEDRYGLKFGKQAFKIDALGRLDETVWQVSQGQVTVGELAVSLNGMIRDGQGSIDIQATAPSAGYVGNIVGLELDPENSLQLNGTLTRRGQLILLDNFMIQSKNGDLGGSISYTMGTIPRVDAKLVSKRFDLSWIADGLEEKIKQQKAKEQEQKVKKTRLIPDWELPLDRLRTFNADLSLQADNVVRKGRDIRNASIRIVVDDGALRIDPWQFEGGSGQLQASLDLQPAQSGAELQFKLNAKNLITELFVTNVEDLGLVPRGDWNMDLRSRGNSLRELAANLDGTSRLTTSSGRVLKAKTKLYLFGDLLGNIMSRVNSAAAKDPYTEISCAVFPFVYQSGIMKTSPSVVVQTDRLNIISHGEINLRNEKLDLSFSSKPRTGVGISVGAVVNPFVRVGGTLAKPDIQLDKTGALLTGGAAFFTGGLSLIAQTAFNAAWRSSDPCAKVVEEAEKLVAKEQ